jgi:hypothetical protein
MAISGRDYNRKSPLVIAALDLFRMTVFASWIFHRSMPSNKIPLFLLLAKCSLENSTTVYFLSFTILESVATLKFSPLSIFDPTRIHIHQQIDSNRRNAFKHLKWDTLIRETVLIGQKGYKAYNVPATILYYTILRGALI